MKPARWLAPFLAAPVLAVPVLGLLPTSVASAQAEGAVTAGADLKFTPPTINIAVGGKVTWTNKGGAFHTVTGGKDGTADSASPIGNAILDSDGKTHVVTFTKAGTYDYFCQPHVSYGMVGQVVVGGGGAAAPSASPPAASPTASAPAASPTATAVQGPATEPGKSAEAEIPGIADNAVLNDVKARRAAEERTTNGFLALMGGATAAMIALAAALVASTRPRR